MENPVVIKGTKQQLFDKMVVGIVKQGKPSIKRRKDPDQVSICQYRHNGNACAIGQLFSDDQYRKKWDKDSPYNVNDLLETELFFPEIKSKDFRDFLEDMQNCHDIAAVFNSKNNAAFINEFLQASASCAKKYKLKNRSKKWIEKQK